MSTLSTNWRQMIAKTDEMLIQRKEGLQGIVKHLVRPFEPLTFSGRKTPRERKRVRPENNLSAGSSPFLAGGGGIRRVV